MTGNEPEPITPDTILWHVAGDIRILAALPPTFVLQVAHPAVGAGVDEYSVFRTDPWGRADRSLHSLQLWVYGGPEAVREGRRLRRLHKDIKGTDTRGRTYHSLQPALYGWVHATAFPGFLRAAKYMSTPLGPAEERKLYHELLQLGRILGLNDRDMPQSPAEFWEYFDRVVEEELEHTVVVAELLDPEQRLPVPKNMPAVVRLVWPLVSSSLTRARVFVSVGLMHPAVRAKLGLPWTARDERRLRLLGNTIRALVPLLPERLRYLPVARRARKATREGARPSRSLTR